jgi:twitching motility protein PilT
MMLADSLRAIITQMLIPNTQFTGMVLATEILIGTLPLSNLIRQEKLHQVSSVMQTGRHLGMRAMDDSIMELLSAGLITESTARRKLVRKNLLDQQSQGARGKQIAKN